MNSNTVIKIDRLGKKFCKSHKKSMRYGMTDLCNKLAGRPLNSGELRTDEFWAVDDVSISLKKGECLGILGPNGSGKSTLLKTINRIIIPDKGSVWIKGNIAAMIELSAGFHPMLTGRENIFLCGAILGLKKSRIQESIQEIIEFSELGEFIDSPVKFYSSGMYIRLGFSIAAQLNPDILLIDEVLAVGDIRFRVKCLEHIRNLQQSGTAIILVSHNIVDILKTATVCIVMDKGKIKFMGEVHDAVEAYHKLMYSGEGIGSSSRRSTFVESVMVLCDKGNKVGKFETGSSLQLKINIKSEINIDDARIIVAIEKPNFGIVSSISSVYQNMKIKITPGINSIVLLLESLPLLKGYYLVNVSLYGAGSEDFHDRVLNAASFEITGPDLDYLGYGISGCIKIAHSWLT